MTEEKAAKIEKLLQEFERTRNEIFKCKAWAEGGRAAEQNYGRAYMALVKAGVKPRIKEKYRHGIK